MESKKFPHDFLWGGAVAAHQLEGGYMTKVRKRNFYCGLL